MPEFKGFPKIHQFRQTIKAVQMNARYDGKDANGDATFDPTKPVPKLKFEGTVKLHGTNAGLIKSGHKAEGKSIYHCQSRQNNLNYPHSDNAGFGMFIHQLGQEVIDDLFYTITPIDDVLIFGEWCGGNIQKNVGINGLPKMFVIFAVKFGYTRDDGYDERWYDVNPKLFEKFNEHNIYHIKQFPTFELEIDFDNPGLAQNKLGEITLEVERECPVAKHFGVSGLGEGVVWRCWEEGYTSSGYTFKVKGEKHSVSKVKTLAPVDVERLNTINEFVDYCITENRLIQGFQATRDLHVGVDLSPKMTGDFIRWVINDVLSEEADTMAKNSLTNKCIGGPISKKAKNWYFAKLDEI